MANWVLGLKKEKGRNEERNEERKESRKKKERNNAEGKKGKTKVSNGRKEDNGPTANRPPREWEVIKRRITKTNASLTGGEAQAKDPPPTTPNPNPNPSHAGGMAQTKWTKSRRTINGKRKKKFEEGKIKKQTQASPGVRLKQRTHRQSYPTPFPTQAMPGAWLKQSEPKVDGL